MVKIEPWISANEAAEIISENSGKPVHPDYVRLLARQNPKKLASKPVDGRTNVYLRTDVEKIKVKAKKVTDRSTEATQNKLPMDENATIPLVEEKPIPAIPTTENASICNVERFEDMPPGSMKRKAFVDKYGIHNPDLGKWLELGLKGDRLPVTYYPYHGDKAAAFNPEQQKEVLTILKRHNKLKGDING